MYERILVAVDGSEISHRALHEAARLCKALGARLRIVTVVETVMLGTADFIDFKEVRKAALKYGEEVQANALKLAKEDGIEAEMELLEVRKASERVTDRIAQAADQWPADLIVIGTHGRRGFNSLLMGSVAEGVVRTATKPVLLVRKLDGEEK